MSANKEGDKAPSYYDEYDEEYESEEEEQEATEGPQAQIGGWTEKGEGEDAPILNAGKKPVKLKKEFDPRKDKMLDIPSDEDFLMDSMKNFKPPMTPKMLDMSAAG